jgi:hypothetical protein
MLVNLITEHDIWYDFFLSVNEGQSIAEQTENRSSDATLQQNDDNMDLAHKDATTKTLP